MRSREIEPTMVFAKLPSDLSQDAQGVRKPLLRNLAVARTDGSLPNAGANPPSEVAGAGRLRQRKDLLNKSHQLPIVSPVVGQDLRECEPSAQRHNQSSVSNSPRRRATDAVPGRPTSLPPQGEPIQFDLDPR